MAIFDPHLSVMATDEPVCHDEQITFVSWRAQQECVMASAARPSMDRFVPRDDELPAESLLTSR